MTTELEELREKNTKAIVMLANLIEGVETGLIPELEIENILSDIVEVLL